MTHFEGFTLVVVCCRQTSKKRPERKRQNGKEKRLLDLVVGPLDLFVGIDLHKERWHITVMTEDVELFNGSIPGKWTALRRIFYADKSPSRQSYLRNSPIAP